MTSNTSVRSALRSATSDSHDRVDRLFSGTDLTDCGAYARFLMAQAEAHLSVEAALDRSQAASVLPDWPQRQRAALLRADLAELGQAPPPVIEVAPFDTPAAVLGAVYVLEGSRLGGRLLQRSVSPDLPTRFLGASDPAGWRTLLATLDERLQGDVERQIAVTAASDVFRLFEASGQRHLKAE